MLRFKKKEEFRAKQCHWTEIPLTDCKVLMTVIFQVCSSTIMPLNGFPCEVFEEAVNVSLISEVHCLVFFKDEVKGDEKVMLTKESEPNVVVF